MGHLIVVEVKRGGRTYDEYMIDPPDGCPNGHRIVQAWVSYSCCRRHDVAWRCVERGCEVIVYDDEHHCP